MAKADEFLTTDDRLKINCILESKESNRRFLVIDFASPYLTQACQMDDMVAVLKPFYGFNKPLGISSYTISAVKVLDHFSIHMTAEETKKKAREVVEHMGPLPQLEEKTND